MIRRYESVAAVARDAAARGAYNNHNNLAFYGGERAADSVRLAQSGDTALVARAESLIGKIDAAITLEHRELIADRVGGYPCVPEYLQGVPDCMRRRAPIESDVAPIAIYVSLGCSAALSADALLQRGAAIMALVIAMSRVRAVDLHILHAGGSKIDSELYCVLTAPINTRPLDLASAAYALSSAGFVRRIVFGLQLALNNYTGAFPACKSSPDYLPGLLRALGGDPARDLIIGPAYAEDQAFADPVAWVNAQIARFREGGAL